MNTLRQRLRDAYNAERKWPLTPPELEAARIQRLLERPADPEPTLQELSARWEAIRKANRDRIDPLFTELMRERGLLPARRIDGTVDEYLA